MLDTLYLAECSQTYRQWIPQLLKGYVRNVVDLWENPSAPLALHDPQNLLVVDEAFVVKGPGPARMSIASLLEPRKILTLPVILLMRRERKIGEMPHGVFSLRRPFYHHELQTLLNEICPEGRKYEEKMILENEPPVLAPSSAVLDEETLQQITREAVEKAVREIVPALAEKIIREEIRRLTE
ncbi:MAG: hypothetical protein U1F57_06865 [bacterium]